MLTSYRCFKALTELVGVWAERSVFRQGRHREFAREHACRLEGFYVGFRARGNTTLRDVDILYRTTRLGKACAAILVAVFTACGEGVSSKSEATHEGHESHDTERAGDALITVHSGWKLGGLFP